jgi:hypothetical protein
MMNDESFFSPFSSFRIPHSSVGTSKSDACVLVLTVSLMGRLAP